MHEPKELYQIEGGKSHNFRVRATAGGNNRSYPGELRLDDRYEGSEYNHHFGPS